MKKEFLLVLINRVENKLTGIQETIKELQKEVDTTNDLLSQLRDLSEDMPESQSDELPTNL